MDVYYPLLNPNYTHIYQYETVYDNYTARTWFKNNWQWFIYISITYVTVIFGIKYLMKERKRYELNKVLLCWNIFLAIFSLMGAMRTGPELVYILKSHSFYSSVCRR